MRRRSWFAVEGTLEPLDHDGPSFFRFPQAVAEHVIERLGRRAVGCEVDEGRAAFSASRVAEPDRVVHGRCEPWRSRSYVTATERARWCGSSVPP